MQHPESVDDYIATFPPEVQNQLHKVRNRILSASPDAEEMISYGMPAYKVHGRVLVYFGGFKNHIGLYATPSGHKEFAEKLSGYKQGKGSVQFKYSEPIPLTLIADMVKFRTEENRLKKSGKSI